MSDPKLKFLVVDDFSTMRRIVRNLLKELGYTNVDEAEDGAIALQKLNSGSFDFVVTDWNMPNMDGITFLKAAKQLPAYKFTPVIMLTTEAGDSKKAEGQAAGAKAWVIKPFQPAQMLAAVSKLILP